MSEEIRKRSRRVKGFCYETLFEIRLEGSLETKDVVCIMFWKYYKRSVL